MAATKKGWKKYGKHMSLRARAIQAEAQRHVQTVGDADLKQQVANMPNTAENASATVSRKKQSTVLKDTGRLATSGRVRLRRRQNGQRWTYVIRWRGSDSKHGRIKRDKLAKVLLNGVKGRAPIRNYERHPGGWWKRETEKGINSTIRRSMRRLDSSISGGGLANALGTLLRDVRDIINQSDLP